MSHSSVFAVRNPLSNGKRYAKNIYGKAGAVDLVDLVQNRKLAMPICFYVVLKSVYIVIFWRHDKKERWVLFFLWRLSVQGTLSINIMTILRTKI